MPPVTPTLAIPQEKVCFVILRAREFEGRDSQALDMGSGWTPWKPPDDPHGVLKLQAEISAYIQALSEDERLDLISLTWLGCGKHTVADWLSLRAEARRTCPTQTTAYLLGTPRFADRLEEGLARFGTACAIARVSSAEPSLASAKT